MSDWPTVRLGDTIELFDSRRRPLSGIERSSRQGAFPYYGASGIIDFIDDYIFDGRYLLVAEDGENLNSRKLPIAFFAEGQFWVNNHAHIVRGKTDVLDDFFLRHWFVQADIGGYVTGAAQPKLSQANLRRIELQLPPLATQRKIAGVLSAYDDLVENNNRRINVLEAMAQRLYREWFVDFRYPGHENVPLMDSAFGPIPEGWESLPASAAMTISPKIAVARDTTLAFVPMTSVSETGMHIAPIERRAGASGTRFENGDTLFARITPSLENGKTAYVQCLSDGEVAVGSTEFIVFRSRWLCPELTYLLARDERLRGHAIQSMAGASGRQRVRAECFDTFMLAVPPSELVDRFARLVRPMFRLSYELFVATANLRTTRDLLLPQLVSGAIDVTDLDVAVPELAA